jgi:mRNA interferase RelE/StbE
VDDYHVEFASSAAKEFRSLPLEIKQRVASSIDELQQNPRPVGIRKLRGHESLFRAKIGSYRVIYEIDDQKKLIRITRIRHRQEAYRNL